MAVDRHVLALLAVIAFVGLGGCLGVSVEVTVDEEGTLEEMVVDMEMDDMLFMLIEEEAEDAGYDDIEEYLLEDQTDEDAWESVHANLTDHDDGVSFILTATDGDPAKIDEIDVELADGNITYTDHDGFDLEDADTGEEFGEFDDFFGQIELTYTVSMPGEVLETNGDVLEDGTTVQWTAEDHGDVESFTVTSKEPTEDAIPGFVLSAAVGALALLGLAMGVFYRKEVS